MPWDDIDWEASSRPAPKRVLRETVARFEELWTNATYQRDYPGKAEACHRMGYALMVRECGLEGGSAFIHVAGHIGPGCRWIRGDPRRNYFGEVY